jgi:hypothetical protein
MEDQVLCEKTFNAGVRSLFHRRWLARYIASDFIEAIAHHRFHNRQVDKIMA